MKPIEMKKCVCAVIVTYNTGKDLLRCFNSIINQVEEVIIIDNGSDEETLSVLNSQEEMHDCVKVFYNEDNLGLAAAQNIGVRYAIDKGYTWILTLDHDSKATPNMIKKMSDAYMMLRKQNIDNIGIIAANPFEVNIQKYLIDQKLFRNNREVVTVERAISSGSLINVSVFKEVGFFNESLFIYYVDDEFCLRCRNKNLNIYVCHSAVLFHKEGIKEARKILWKNPWYNNYDFRARYYISRNAIYMIRRYLKSHRYRNCYYLIEKMIKDTIKIILFESNKMKLLFYAIKGIWDGIGGKYGEINCER